MLGREKNFLSNSRTILSAKLKESLSSVLPVTCVVFFLCFFFIPIPSSVLVSFIIGALMLVLGMGLFTLGADTAMTPIGENIGASLTKSKRIWFIILIAFLVGSIVTISEPDIQVLSSQITNIPTAILIIAIAGGVGFFLVVAILRIFLRIKLSRMLVILYGMIIILSFFVPNEFIAIAFDSGGVTTGPMTVPFIMALGIGIAATRSDKYAEEDSFGLVALCSVGPIVSVMILGLIYEPTASAYATYTIHEVTDSKQLQELFSESLKEHLGSIALSLVPIIIFFALFQIRLKMKKSPLMKIGIGMLYTFLGIVIFLAGATVGFMPMGNYLGRQLFSLESNWLIVPIGMVLGYVIVMAEPAVHILTNQVYDITSGAIPKKAMRLSLSVGVSGAIGLAMLRIIADIPIMYIIIPGYAIALALSFFSPPIFTAIAFDSGGVASGPIATTFLLPLATGACAEAGGHIALNGFGVIAMVAMTPLITIQMLGVYFKMKSSGKNTPVKETDKTTANDIIDL